MTAACCPRQMWGCWGWCVVPSVCVWVTAQKGVPPLGRERSWACLSENRLKWVERDANGNAIVHYACQANKSMPCPIEDSGWMATVGRVAPHDCTRYCTTLLEAQEGDHVAGVHDAVHRPLIEPGNPSVEVKGAKWCSISGRVWRCFSSVFPPLPN